MAPAIALNLRYSCGVPGVEYRDAETDEILHVSRHDGKIVLKGRRGDEPVRHL